jgi:hypothetical protein
MNFAEFYVTTTGDNLNSGSSESDAASYTFASGNWVQSTRVFTLASGDTTGVTVGMFASVYADGSTVTGYVGRISAVTSTTITIDGTANAGTAPTDGTANRTVKIGGAWAHPSTPLLLSNKSRLILSSGTSFCRINVKAATYSVASVITVSGTGDDGSSASFYVQGYTTTPGDGGRFRLEGSATGTAYTLLNLNSRSCKIIDFEIGVNGNSGSSQLIQNGASAILINGLIGPARGHGYNASIGTTMFRCRVFDCTGIGNRSDFGGGICIQCLFRNCDGGTLYVPATQCVFESMTSQAHVVDRGLLFQNTYIRCPTVFGGGIVGDSIIQNCVAVNCTTLFSGTVRRAFVNGLYHFGTTTVFSGSAESAVIHQNIVALSANPLENGGGTGTPRAGNWKITSSASQIIGVDDDALFDWMQDSATYDPKTSDVQRVIGAAWPVISSSSGSAAVDPLGGGLIR